MTRAERRRRAKSHGKYGDLAGLRPLVLALFGLSGVSGLIYQVIWARQLTLVFGATSLAVTTVLTTFMLGLGLGSYAAGRWARRAGNPLRLYATVELGIAA